MAIFTVSDSAGLYQALANATGGDTIELAGGDYGKLDLSSKSGFDITFDTPVTITSTDPNVRASFSEMDLRGVANLTLDNVVFDYTYGSSDELWQSPFSIADSSNITIRNSLFDGDVASGRSEIDDGYGFAKGLSVRDTAGISIENNEFSTWHRGLVVLDSQDISVTGNDIHSIRSDGMNFSEVQSVLIEGNYIHDFKASIDSADHRDMIQFWTNGTDAPSADITIRDNTLDIGDGNYTQSIFMRNDMVDRGLAGPELFYQNILIEENIILNGHSHGITVGETSGLTIRNNTILSILPSDEDFDSIPKINVASAATSVTIQQNVVGAISGYDNQSDWSLGNNAFVQNTDLGAPGFYTDQFFESSVEGGDNPFDYIAAPGGLIDTLSAGASRLLLDTTPDTLTPQFDVKSAEGTPQTLVFDATHTYGPAGQVTSDDATFLWTFGDGTTATGRVVEHSYGAAGGYDVALTVLLDGQAASTAVTASAEVGVAGSDILTLNAEDGQFYLQGYGAQMLFADGAEQLPASRGETAVDLGGTGTLIEIPRVALTRFFGTDSFEMSMTLQADKPGTSSGEVARIHSSIIVSVQGDGDLNVRLFPDSGEKVNLTTSGISINDGAKHDISIVLDGDTDSFQIVIDGTVAASQTVTGSMPEMGSWGLAFGEPWGGQNFDGKLSAFELKADASDYPAFDGSLDGSTGTGSYDEGALPVLDDFIADFAQLTNKQLHGDAYVGTIDDDSIVYLDGENDHAKIGKLAQFDDSDQLSFSVSYSKDTQSDETQRLVWKSKDVGLAVDGDSLKVYVGQADNPFRKAIKINDLGLDDTETHQVTVMIDAITDRVQVVLDGALVLDKQQGIDITFSDEFDRAWKVGGGNRGNLDGEIYDLRIDASADFLPDSLLVPDDASLVA